MTPCLHQNALAGVHQDYGEGGKGSADRHIPGVFFVTRSVRNDKGPLFCREIAVGHVDRDPLLSLRHQAVKQEGIIDLASAGPDLGLQFQSPLLVREDQLCVIEHMSDQGRLSVVNAAAGDKF